MTGIEIAALAVVAAWLGIVSLVTLLNVRQIAILTVRAERVSTVNPNEDGLPIGFDIPLGVTEAIPDTQTGAIIALMSATCGPCREVAAELAAISVRDPVTVLLTGSNEPRAAVAALLPAHVAVIEDPDAAHLAGLLKIQSSPFALRMERGTVVAKAYVSEAATLERLYEPPAGAAPDTDETTNLEVIASVD